MNKIQFRFFLLQQHAPQGQNKYTSHKSFSQWMFPLPICDNENAGNTYYRKSLHMKCALKDSTKGRTSDTFEHIQPKMVLN